MVAVFPFMYRVFAIRLFHHENLDLCKLGDNVVPSTVQTPGLAENTRSSLSKKKFAVQIFGKLEYFHIIRSYIFRKKNMIFANNTMVDTSPLWVFFQMFRD